MGSVPVFTGTSPGSALSVQIPPTLPDLRLQETTLRGVTQIQSDLCFSLVKNYESILLGLFIVTHIMTQLLYYLYIIFS